MRRLCSMVLLLGVVGCTAYRSNLVEVKDVDGSSDHRIFRIASVTKLMMEPVLWQLEDSHLIDFDRSVTNYFKGSLPPEYGKVTLRMLRNHESGLPREFIDPWCLGDVYKSFKCGCVGSNIYEGFDTRADFVLTTWSPKWRGCVRRKEAGYSSMGYALMMMAICDHLEMTPEELLQRYLVRPYGLEDTSYEITDGIKSRLTMACAGHMPWWRLKGQEIPENRRGEITMVAGGMLSSASDILKICYVMLPHLDRAKGLFKEYQCKDGRRLYYRSGMIYGGNAFVAMDPTANHSLVILKNQTCWPTIEGIEMLENIDKPQEGNL